MNDYGINREPFLFIINYRKDRCYIYRKKEIPASDITFSFNGTGNSRRQLTAVNTRLEFTPVSLDDYRPAFMQVQSEISEGNSYLTNLTFSTPINSSLNLEELFHLSQARYRLWLRNQFLVFSPETFVRIHEGKIYSFPMKGTIRANLENASQRILSDKKEIAEHATIVDLIRNDLSVIAKNVRVNKFRYLERIHTNREPLLQVSSEIMGDLPEDQQYHLGDIIFALLPAGSICGAPKRKTLEIIEEVETHQRGFYTGICGYFDGRNLDSGVMIRFIQEHDNKLFFKSGGGITSMSNLESEYQEYIEKIYVPTF
ncbi:MAG: aminodeoxychorismate synthase component I [Saprospiraceae bacterium]|nr:aminodeoxychorismate synthase component I [Saprospiraceae bacterium]